MGCEALIKAIDAYLAKADDDLQDALDEAGFVKPKDTVKNIGKLEDKVADALKAENDIIQAKMDSAVDLDAFVSEWPGLKAADATNADIGKLFLADFKTQMPKLASAYVKKIDPALTVKTITRRTTGWIESWSEELGQLMKLTTHDEVEKLIKQTLESGEGIAELARHFKESGIREEQYRARAAALTETLRAHSVAQQEAIIQNPSVSQKGWKHTGNHKNTPRENHVAMDGVVVAKDDPFELVGADGETYYPMYPRDTILPAVESVNCHCIHQGIADEDVLGLPLEERKRLQQEAIDADDGKWEEELNTRNKAKAGIE